MKTENRKQKQLEGRASNSSNGRNRHFQTDCEEAHDC